MKRNFINCSSANRLGAMETVTIKKNGAIPKSRTIRRNLFKNKFTVLLLLCATLFGCGKNEENKNDDGDSQISSISFNKESVTLAVGQKEKLTATINPAGMEVTSEWKSSTPTVASVNGDGEITAVAVGNATVTLTAGGKSATCSVTVLETPFQGEATTMTMKIKPVVNYVIIGLTGSGKITVDWGDGKSDDFQLTGTVSFCSHVYSSISSNFTVTVKGNVTELSLGEKISGLDRGDAIDLLDLDVSGNTALVYLDCGTNKLTNLDLSKNTALGYLDCSDNQLQSLDLSKNTALGYLNCSYNQLQSLDLSKIAAISYLDCSYNQLTGLDASKCAELKILH
ncbi:MAG: Ig-like domain-containing protein, partial [Prevotellaceae bacterium]|nr:Ig-like domain-containing protein [Prevotellaceae bacterium]